MVSLVSVTLLCFSLKAMGVAGQSALEAKIGNGFFERRELNGESLDFCVDKKRFQQILHLGKQREWMELAYDEGSKRMDARIMGRMGNVTRFTGIYYQAAYGAGFTSRERSFRNNLAMHSEEFGNLLECFGEWKENSVGISCERNDGSWRFVFKFGDPRLVKCERAYCAWESDERKQSEQDYPFVLMEVINCEAGEYDFKKIRTVWDKLSMRKDKAVVVSVNDGEPLCVSFRLGEDFFVEMYVPPQEE